MVDQFAGRELIYWRQHPLLAMKPVESLWIELLRVPEGAKISGGIHKLDPLTN